MRAWQIVGGFGLEHLKKVTLTEEALKPDELRVKMHACSLNYRDLMVMKGIYNPKQVLPLIPLSDGAGEVVEVGSSVRDFKVHDRVCGTFSERWCYGPPSDEAMSKTLGSPLPGTLSERRVFPETGLIKFPKHLSYVEAATLPCAGVTAFNAIALQSGLKPGDTVLLLGSGGVSIFALQFAKAWGLKTIMVSSSDEKLAKASSLSLDHGINYIKNERWHEVVLDITQGQGVDAVIEVGGAQTLKKSIASVKKAGVVSVIGVLSGVQEPLDIRPLLMNNIRLQGIFVGAKTVFSAMNRVLEHANIHPVVDKVFDFDEAPKAFSHLDSSQHFGKLCIEIKA